MRLVSRLLSDDLEVGVLAANVALVGFGLWCWWVPVRRGRSSAVPLAWMWVALESANGIGHLVGAIGQGGYAPGVGTAPMLIAVLFNLGRYLRQASGATAT